MHPTSKEKMLPCIAVYQNRAKQRSDYSELQQSKALFNTIMHRKTKYYNGKQSSSAVTLTFNRGKQAKVKQNNAKQ